ncbi:acylphosphatase [Rhodocyclus tenuis]|uniref:acylphosphatase n=1 Tax=Rhodocyclus gracilis TaxID=2929842 RepID=A0ABX0WHW1_9RHOO|nr:acylphosphatase [Rhodocyclus gracilis]NJA88260.1 acylphosphatase [Rhodocyclus gracilis]
MSNSNKPAETVLKLRVRGRVQGVGYRRSLQIMARSLDLAGWVRNRADGSVEALVAGDAATVAELCEWARCGPPLARVDAMETAVPDGKEAGESTPFPFAVWTTC